MAEANEWLTNVVLIGLVLISLGGFAVGLGSNYDKTAKEMIGTSIDLSNIENSINQTGQQASAWKKALESDSPFIKLGVLFISSIWSTLLAMLSLILAFISIYLTTISNIFGVPVIVISGLTTLAVVSLIIMIYKMVKS